VTIYRRGVIDTHGKFSAGVPAIKINLGKDVMITSVILPIYLRNFSTKFNVAKGIIWARGKMIHE
jgi:hypothetical protein